MVLWTIRQYYKNKMSGDDYGDYYVLTKITLPFGKHLNVETGLALGVLEEGGAAKFCFAASGKLAWLPPGGRDKRLSLGMAFSSGAWNDSTRAFLPINTIAQGKTLRPGLSGLALGAELYGGLSWAPVSDINFTLGGGAFFPGWGRAFDAVASIRRRRNG